MTRNLPASEQRASDVRLAPVTGDLWLGGSSTFLVNLARVFGRRDLAFPVIVLSENNEHAADFTASNTPIELISRRTNIYEERLRRGYEALARWQPRAVLACLGAESFELLRIVPPGVARIGIVQSHEPGPYEVVKTYARHMDAVIGVSREITTHLASLPEIQQNRVRVEYIPYGIDFGLAVQRSFADAARPLRVIYLGRLIEEQKRVSRLVELARKMAEAGLPVEFTIAGSGPEEARLRGELATFNFVRLPGSIPNNAVGPLLAEQDLFVLLSDYEGLPLSLLEAMGAGVVPLVSDLPSGMREVVREDTGFRVPVGDVAQAFHVIAGISKDRAQLQPLSAAAAALARTDYSAERMGDRYLGLAESLTPKPVHWPGTTRVPVPYGMSPFVYAGPMRALRRWLKARWRNRR